MCCCPHCFCPVIKWRLVRGRLYLFRCWGGCVFFAELAPQPAREPEGARAA